MPIDLAENSHPRPGLLPRSPSSSGLLACASERLQAAQAGVLNRDSLLLDRHPPDSLLRDPVAQSALDAPSRQPVAKWLRSLVPHWSLDAPRRASHARADAAGERMARLCTLVEIHDIAHLMEAVPALQERRAGTYVAFDLDDTLIHRPREFDSMGRVVKGDHALAQPGKTLETLAHIKELHTCVALTARNFDSGYRTYFLLQRLGIDFAPAPGQPGKLPHLENAGKLGGLYFAGHRTPKGDLLATLRQDFPDMRHLVFIDDQPSKFFSMVDANVRGGSELKLTCVSYSGCRDGASSARGDWSKLKEAFRQRSTAMLGALQADDRRWHDSLGRGHSAHDMPVTAMLASYLHRDRPELAGRLGDFLAGVRRYRLLKGEALTHLGHAVAAAQAAVSEQATGSGR